jgi:hypothetical protein
MIVGQFTGIEGPAAVLAQILVAEIDVLPGKTDGMVPKSDEMKQPHHSRKSDGKSNRPHLPIIAFKDLYLAKSKKSDRPFPGYDS